jgi:hypothetical protein
MPVSEILRQYSRYFLGEHCEAEFAEGLAELERNWRGPLTGHLQVPRTLTRFQELEKKARPGDLKNWRFQQALLRAYFDAYTQRRLMAENARELEAMNVLRKAQQTGALATMAAAEEVLSSATGQTNDPMRKRVFQLAEALYQNIGMQLSVERYRAISVGRGAMLDTIDFPLNNRVWLTERFSAIRQLQTEPERLRAIDEILNWTQPGPGGYYDDLGNSALQPHLVSGPGFVRDPASFEAPRANFADEPLMKDAAGSMASTRRTSWLDHEEALYDAPLKLAYADLDPSGQYRVRVVYCGDNYQRKIRLVANESIEIHPLIEKPMPFKPLEFAVPQEATRGGKLTLSWTAEPGLGGNGRSCQVSEVWLLKAPIAGAEIKSDR